MRYTQKNVLKMKNLILILSIFLAIPSFSQKTYVPDDNFEQALIDLGHDNVLDDSVLTVDIESLTSLSVFNKNISDLTGVEDFIALTSLNCGMNNLSSANFTQNVALEVLMVDGNNLTTIDVTQNTNLIQLFVGANNLTNIDLSQNVVLELFNCHSNSITSLNLINNPALSRLFCQLNQISILMLNQHTNLFQLWCHNNQLSYLNLKNGNNLAISDSQFNATNNPSLTCIEVDDAVFSSATWTNIDASASFSSNCGNALTYVPDDNFEQKLINLGHDSGALNDYVPTANIENLTFLNVFNSNISDLTGIEDFISLIDFKCHLNNLTTLDFSQNTALVTLACDNNNLTSLDVSQNSNLEILRCHGNNLTTLDISQNSIIYELWVHSNLLNSLNLTANDSLKTLWCNNNQLTDLDLSMNTVLSDLRCNDNNLGTLNVKNGNNSNVIDANFVANNNPNLTCVTVDSPSYSQANWSNVDAGVIFNLNCSTIGLNENQSDNISIYPNPSNGLLNIDFGEVNSAEISVVNIHGKEIYRAKVENQNIYSFELNTEPGIYFINITENTKRSVFKIVID